MFYKISLDAIEWMIDSMTSARHWLNGVIKKLETLYSVVRLYSKMGEYYKYEDETTSEVRSTRYFHYESVISHESGYDDGGWDDDPGVNYHIKGDNFGFFYKKEGKVKETIKTVAFIEKDFHTVINISGRRSGSGTKISYAEYTEAFARWEKTDDVEDYLAKRKNKDE